MKNPINKAITIFISTLTIVTILNVSLFLGGIYINVHRKLTLNNINREMGMFKYKYETETRKFLNELKNIGSATIKNDRTQRDLMNLLNSNIGVLETRLKEIKNKMYRLTGGNLENIEDIIKSNLLIVNETRVAFGSGTHIKLRGYDYILTCSHLSLKPMEETLYAEDIDGRQYPMELVKYNVEKDLALYRVHGIASLPYLEIAGEEPSVGTPTIVIGNPAGSIDVITDGIIAKKVDYGYLLTNLAYYGNSGGALIVDGKLVGVLVEIRCKIKPPVYVNYSYATGLKAIQDLLEGVR